MTGISQGALAPISFSFETEQPLRVITIDGEPWFVATDVCALLGIKNPSQSVAALDDDERAMFNIGRQGLVNIVSESGLYTLILRCRDAVKAGTLPHRVRKWVTNDVLPTIRKTGSYALPSHPLLVEPDPGRPISSADYKRLESKVHALAAHFGRTEATSRAIWAYLREQLGLRVSIRTMRVDQLDDARHILNDLQDRLLPYIQARNEFDRAWLGRLLGGAATHDLLH